jgi:hypothetical protein
MCPRESAVESLQDEMGLNVTGRLTTRAKEQLLLAGGKCHSTLISFGNFDAAQVHYAVHTSATSRELTVTSCSMTEGDLRRLSSKFKALKSMEPEEIVNPPYLQHMSEHGARLARLESAAFQIAGEVSLVAKKVQQLLAEHGELVGRLNDMFLGLDETLGC